MIIYLIRNKINGKCYVGQTVKSLRRRWTLHYNNGRSALLTRAINKYGKESFDVSEVQKCSSHEEMDAAEAYWIAKLNSLAPQGYNLRSGGQGKGEAIHEMTREKIRKAWKHRPPFSDETRRRMSEGQKRLLSENPEFKKLRASFLRKSDGHLHGHPARNRRKIRCIETGEIYLSATHAARDLGLDHSTVCAVARGKWKHTRGVSFAWEG